MDKKGPAWDAGLRPNQLVTHINGESITGLQQVQVLTIMADKKNQSITVSTIALDQTSIRKDKRKRTPTMGHRVGKLFRHRSSGSGKIKKRPSFFNRLRNKDRSHPLDSPGHSSSGTPSPKLPSSPHRSDSFKEKIRRKMIKSSDRHRRQTPVSPLARSTSPGPITITHMTPNSSPPGSMQNISGATPPNSPPVTFPRRPERHSMFVDSQLLMHKKSHSVCELSPSVKRTPSSPQTSPLLKRALSPSEVRRKGAKPRRSITLPREVSKKRSPKMVSIVTPPKRNEDVEEVEEEEEGLVEATTLL